MSSLRESKRMFGWRPGDILLVKERSGSSFFPNITTQQLRTEEELMEMLQVARNHEDAPFWNGVEKALLWSVLKSVNDGGLKRKKTNRERGKITKRMLRKY